MYLLDTNHCSQIIGANPDVIKKLQENSIQGVGISAITRDELIFMIERFERVEENYKRFSPFLDNINTYLIDNAISDCYGKLKANILKHFGPKDKKQARNTTIQKLGFSDNDLWIAATAISYNLTVVSADSDFVRIQEVQALTLENWCFGTTK
ncbi:MAG: type II toxin-antitoxin system VapC family toxin [Coleofasciculus sp. S288]|nr:type II toxin-antitoxin system VapC family toxin [Coleofasciculus sp. S288]